MRNPIHKRLENVESWQHLTFMACLCERMAPNFALFCQMTEQKPADKTYHNILNLVWEFLTVKEAKINFENQLEKLEEIIPDVNEYDFFGLVPALDACESDFAFFSRLFMIGFRELMNRIHEDFWRTFRHILVNTMT